MDLVRFELTTSSMPFKKYQSVAGILNENKRLTTRRFGRRWTPHADPKSVWTPPGLRDSTLGTSTYVLSRPVIVFTIAEHLPV